MAEYIEREALLAQLEERRGYLFKKNGDYDHYSNGFDEAVDHVEAFPAADVVEVKRGRWIPTPEYDSCWCLCCKKQYTGFFASYWNFCPNCGSRMGGD